VFGQVGRTTSQLIPVTNFFAKAAISKTIFLKFGFSIQDF
jgi:hypothetical protein